MDLRFAGKAVASRKILAESCKSVERSKTRSLNRLIYRKMEMTFYRAISSILEICTFV